VIRNTFSPFMDVGKHVPPALITELDQSFSSKEPYILYPDVQKFFLELQKYKDASKTRQLPWPFKRIVVGIISNSDDRVPGILQSFGLQVGSRRAGASSNIETHSSFGNDIDFVVLSYDVGYEKPHRRIFDAATSLLSGMPSDDGGQLNPDDFEKLYVGDELKKDYQGANRVGWHSVLLDRNGVMDRARGFRFGRVGLEDENGKEHKVLMARSLLDLELWRPISPISQTWNNHERLHPWESDSNAK
jgi:FMN phosphatase YigB (HAD superfamily)